MVLAEAAESKVESRDVEACFANLELDWEGYRRLQRVAVSGEGNRKLFEQLTDVIRDEDLKGATKKGACLYVLGKITEARAALEKAHPQSEMASVLLGQLHDDAERWSEAKATYKAALDTNKASKRALFGLIKSSLMLAETDEAASLLASAGKAHDGDAEFLYVKAFAAELSGEYHEAAELFEKVIKLDPNHARALFRLGRYHTTWGNIEKAVDYYERCCSQTPTYGNALINLGVLYEDLNRWEEACRCYQLVLKAVPAHPRASMYLKDAEASKSMFYDEDRERRNDRQAAVLGIPVSDFELSVRSRNCLNKMNIRTLGDLMKMTEPELLAHKNFGETSLLEVKQMLAQKGLRLAQHRGQTGGFIGQVRDTAPTIVDREDVLKKPISELQLSVRSRNCMSRLQIKTVGDLTERTEQELLAAKNFGDTSLSEIRSRLSEFGLSLKKAH